MKRAYGCVSVCVHSPSQGPAACREEAKEQRLKPGFGIRLPGVQIQALPSLCDLWQVTFLCLFSHLGKIDWGQEQYNLPLRVVLNDFSQAKHLEQCLA